MNTPKSNNRNYFVLANMQEKCRACLESIEPTWQCEEVGIVQPKSVNNSLLSPDIRRLFVSFTTVDVTYEMEEFPKHLCQLCVDKLNEYMKFRETVLTSTRSLYLSMQKSVIGTTETNVCSLDQSLKCAAIMDATGWREENEDDGNEKAAADQSTVGIACVEVVENDDSEDQSDNNSETSDSVCLNNQSMCRDNKENLHPIEPENTDVHFNAHMLNVHQGKDNRYSCEKCRKYFKTSLELTIHKDEKCTKSDSLLKENNESKMLNSSGDRNTTFNEEFACKLCSKQMSTKFNLGRHMKRHEIPEKHKCPECDFASKSKKVLVIHKRVHKEKPCTEKPVNFNCPHCPKLFKSKKSVRPHIREKHERIENYSCSLCPKRFSSHPALLTHQNSHGRYFCNICDKRFKKDNDFKQHMKRHTKYQCNLCPNSFPNLKNLSDHQKVHLGDNPNVCSVCGHGFNNVQELKLHVEHNHADNNTNADDPGVQNVINGEQAPNGKKSKNEEQDNLIKSVNKSVKRKRNIDDMKATEENYSIDNTPTHSKVKSIKKGIRYSSRISVAY